MFGLLPQRSLLHWDGPQRGRRRGNGTQSWRDQGGFVRRVDRVKDRYKRYGFIRQRRIDLLVAIMPCVDFHIDSTRFCTSATTSIDRLTPAPPAPPAPPFPSQAPSIPSRLPPLDWSPASVRFFNSTDVPRFDAPDSRVDDDESPSPPAVSARRPDGQPTFSLSLASCTPSLHLRLNHRRL